MNKKKYEVIFFDLDRTLWDYESNSKSTLIELLQKYAPNSDIPPDQFVNTFYKINESLWKEYRNNNITKIFLSDNRFILTFREFGHNATSFAEKIRDEYISEGPKKTKLFSNTIQSLEYLKNQGYKLYLLTNGFEEVQKTKIKASNLDVFFEKMITSEKVGYQKPAPEIFEYALKISNSEKEKCLMIGDDLECDILGAQTFGIDTAFTNYLNIDHKVNPNYEINDLSQLKSFL